MLSWNFKEKECALQFIVFIDDLLSTESRPKGYEEPEEVKRIRRFFCVGRVLKGQLSQMFRKRVPLNSVGKVDPILSPQLVI